jgi:hypothetical protein
MTTREKTPTAALNTDTPRPAAERLFQKPVTQWYAEWKARRAAAGNDPPPAAGDRDRVDR